jgi:hypothetical protein
MCYGYEEYRQWREGALEQRRLELLERQRREKDAERREVLRASQEAELRQLERELTRIKAPTS